jgi:hypothetical protein
MILYVIVGIIMEDLWVYTTVQDSKVSHLNISTEGFVDLEGNHYPKIAPVSDVINARIYDM